MNAPPPEGDGFHVTDSSPVPSEARPEASGPRPASPLLPLGLADIEEEPIDGLDILPIEPHLIARTILECREEDREIPLPRAVLARMFEDCVSISDEELDALCSA